MLDYLTSTVTNNNSDRHSCIRVVQRIAFTAPAQRNSTCCCIVAYRHVNSNVPALSTVANGRVVDIFPLGPQGCLRPDNLLRRDGSQANVPMMPLGSYIRSNRCGRNVKFEEPTFRCRRDQSASRPTSSPSQPRRQDPQRKPRDRFFRKGLPHGGGSFLDAGASGLQRDRPPESATDFVARDPGRSSRATSPPKIDCDSGRPDDTANGRGGVVVRTRIASASLNERSRQFLLDIDDVKRNSTPDHDSDHRTRAAFDSA